MDKEACSWGKSEAHTLYCENCYAVVPCGKAEVFENSPKCKTLEARRN